MDFENSALKGTDFNWPGVHEVYHGKVRDVYFLDERLVIVATDRISAFDYILPRPIPFKGQVLNQIAAYFLRATKDIVPNWLEATPDPNVSIGTKAVAYPVEMVIRGYLSGHAWRIYKSGERIICGVRMPEGMKENDPFPTPIITPTTKAAVGHDTDISKEEILSQHIVSEEDWNSLESFTHKLFQRGTEMALERGLILVDTKYEFGKADDKIILIDEIHTPDSSRYFYNEGYTERQDKGEQQTQLSKEFVREWLMANGFQGLEGQQMPFMDDAFIMEVSARYIQLYEIITGQTFNKADVSQIESRIYNNVLSYLNIHK